MPKNIQMPFSFFNDVFLLLIILEDYYIDERTDKLRFSLESQIKSKISAMQRRIAFSKYKSELPGTDERELNRRDYLDKACVHRDWRSQIEILP
jgi:hypothetical protein